LVFGGAAFQKLKGLNVGILKFFPKLKDFFKPNATLDKGLELQVIEDQKCICNKGRLVIPKPLQRHATMWYHHYLQHLGHHRLEGMMNQEQVNLCMT
jgi:hypothetical protein